LKLLAASTHRRDPDNEAINIDKAKQERFIGDCPPRQFPCVTSKLATVVHHMRLARFRNANRLEIGIGVCHLTPLGKRAIPGRLRKRISLWAGSETRSNGGKNAGNAAVVE
jgi:hypothetical protein